MPSINWSKKASSEDRIDILSNIDWFKNDTP